MSDSLRVALGDELATVHTHDRQLVRKPLFELPQLREDVDAVDSAVGPEVQNRDLSTQIGDGEGSSVGVDPVETRGKVGRSNDWQLDFAHRRRD